MDMARKPQTYEAARAAMGGAAWLEAPKSTDAWYVVDGVAPGTGNYAQVGRRPRIVVLVVAALMSLSIGALAARTLGHRAAPPPAPAVTPAVTPMAPPAPEVTAVAAAEPAAQPAAPAHHKRVHAKRRRRF